MPRKGKSQIISDILWVPAGEIIYGWGGPGYLLMNGSDPDVYVQTGRYDNAVYPCGDRLDAWYVTNPSEWAKPLGRLLVFNEAGPLKKAALQQIAGEQWREFVGMLRTLPKQSGDLGRSW